MVEERESLAMTREMEKDSGSCTSSSYSSSGHRLSAHYLSFIFSMADDSSTVGSSGPLAFSLSGDQTKLANAATVEVGSVVVGDDQDLVIVMLIQLFEGSCKHIRRSCMFIGDSHP